MSKNMHAGTCIHRILAYMHTYVHTHTHTYTHTHTHTYIRLHTCTCKQTHTYTHIDTRHMHTTHVHTQMIAACIKIPTHQPHRPVSSAGAPPAHACKPGTVCCSVEQRPSCPLGSLPWRGIPACWQTCQMTDWPAAEGLGTSRTVGRSG